MGRPKGSIHKPRLVPAQWLSAYTRYVKRALEARGVPERNQPKNDDLIAELAARLPDWLDWKQIDKFIDAEANANLGEGESATHHCRRDTDTVAAREGDPWTIRRFGQR
jgi:hypothetical protein